MSAPRFFVPGRATAGVELALESDDAHHAAHVLRLGPGDQVVVTDAAQSWDAEIIAVEKNGVRARVLREATERGAELPIAITVLQALTKGAKFDDVVEKCVELGATRIIPVRCARSYADATSTRRDRWRRIARAAAMQSRRRIITGVDEPTAWGDAIASLGVPLLVAWEHAPAGSLATTLSELASTNALAIAVGPEGSFTDDEIRMARERGASLVSLGPTILRTETAAAALLAAIASRFGW